MNTDAIGGYFDQISQKRTNPREGIETVAAGRGHDACSFCQKRTNPREGIETLAKDVNP